MHFKRRHFIRFSLSLLTSMDREISDYTFSYYALIASSEIVKCLLCLPFVPFPFHHSPQRFSSPGENQILIDTLTLLYITLRCQTFFSITRIYITTVYSFPFSFLPLLFFSSYIGLIYHSLPFAFTLYHYFQ